MSETKNQQNEDSSNPQFTLAAPSDPCEIFNMLFASRKPKHALQGLSDGVRNIAVGVGLGVGSLVALPYSKKNEGVGEIVKGVGLGLLSFGGLATYGVATGVSQMCRGVYHSKEAVEKAFGEDSFWDSTEGCWVVVHLKSMLEGIPATDDDIFTEAQQLYWQMHEENKNKPNAEEEPKPSSPESNDYYAFLDVPRTATQAEIRTAFHRKAVVMHPDKNPNDPMATIHFQKLLEANNVLSDSNRRRQYDTNGTFDSTGCQNSSFTQIEESLGAEFLHPFIGRVSWALLFVPNAYFDVNLRKVIQRRRTLRISQYLSRFIDEDGSLDAMVIHIRDAISTRAGPLYMKIVAQQYATAARQHLYDNGFLREMDSFSTSTVAGVSHFAGACHFGIKGACSKLNEEDMIEVMVTLSEPDVRKTVLRACRYLLYDTSVSKEIRHRRAENLVKLSDLVLQEVKKVQEEKVVVSQTPAA